MVGRAAVMLAGVAAGMAARRRVVRPPPPPPPSSSQLTACHAAGVVHGDVKPANIQLDAGAAAAALGGTWVTPFLRLADFGLARSIDPSPGAVVPGTRGTPVFMAPEVFRGAYGRPADVWAAGVTLYQCVSGHYPFWHSADEVMALTPRQVRARVLDEGAAFDGASLGRGGASAELSDLLASLLARDPDARPTAQDALSHPWFRAVLPGDRPGGERGVEGVLAHRSMAACEVCDLSRCPLAGAASPLARVVDDASAAEVK